MSFEVMIMRLIILSGWFMAGVLAWAGPGDGEEPSGGGDGHGYSGGIDFALKPKGLGQGANFNSASMGLRSNTSANSLGTVFMSRVRQT